MLTCNDCIHSEVCVRQKIYGEYSITECKGHFLGKADVQEVKHGKWIEHFLYGCWHYDCPFCDDGFATKEKCKTKPNYCGNCGAKMDKRSAENG